MAAFTMIINENKNATNHVLIHVNKTKMHTFCISVTEADGDIATVLVAVEVVPVVALHVLLEELEKEVAGAL
jgi:hypothetical protein